MERVFPQVWVYSERVSDPLLWAGSRLVYVAHAAGAGDGEACRRGRGCVEDELRVRECADGIGVGLGSASNVGDTRVRTHDIIRPWLIHGGRAHLYSSRSLLLLPRNSFPDLGRNRRAKGHGRVRN